MISPPSPPKLKPLKQECPASSLAILSAKTQQRHGRESGLRVAQKYFMDCFCLLPALKTDVRFPHYRSEGDKNTMANSQ